MINESVDAVTQIENLLLDFLPPKNTSFSVRNDNYKYYTKKEFNNLKKNLINEFSPVLDSLYLKYQNFLKDYSDEYFIKIDKRKDFVNNLYNKINKEEDKNSPLIEKILILENKLKNYKPIELNSNESKNFIYKLHNENFTPKDLHLKKILKEYFKLNLENVDDEEIETLQKIEQIL